MKTLSVCAILVLAGLCLWSAEGVHFMFLFLFTPHFSHFCFANFSAATKTCSASAPWPKTTGGKTASVNCDVGTGKMTRACSTAGKWGSISRKGCTVYNPSFGSDGQCGKDAGGAVCDKTGDSYCCSEYGWCGSTAEYCSCATCIDFRQVTFVNKGKDDDTNGTGQFFVCCCCCC